MSESLSPAALAAVSTAASATPVPSAAPRAVRHFGLAAMEARAARSRAAATGGISPARPVLAPVIPTPAAPQPVARPPVAPPPAAPPRAAPPRAAMARPVRVRLWLPLTALFLLLSPFALLLALPCYLIPPSRRPDPLRAALAVGRLLLSLGGTFIDIQTQGALVRIRIF